MWLLTADSPCNLPQLNFHSPQILIAGRTHVCVHLRTPFLAKCTLGESPSTPLHKRRTNKKDYRDFISLCNSSQQSRSAFLFSQKASSNLSSTGNISCTAHFCLPSLRYTGKDNTRWILPFPCGAFWCWDTQECWCPVLWVPPLQSPPPHGTNDEHTTSPRLFLLVAATNKHPRVPRQMAKTHQADLGFRPCFLCHENKILGQKSENRLGVF